MIFGKEEQRRLLKDKRNALSAAEVLELSNKICNACIGFLASEAIKRKIASCEIVNNVTAKSLIAKNVTAKSVPGGDVIAKDVTADEISAGALLLYSSIQNEVDLTELFLCCKDGIPCFYPLTNGSDMTFHKVVDIGELTAGNFGIKEPDATSPEYNELCIAKGHVAAKAGDVWISQTKTVCFVPGVAFDISGNRLGYGAGYYDRFLESHPEVIRVGVGYDFQVLDRIQADEHDIKMQYIITEKGVFKSDEA